MIRELALDRAEYVELLSSPDQMVLFLDEVASGESSLRTDTLSQSLVLIEAALHSFSYIPQFDDGLNLSELGNATYLVEFLAQFS
jgi:hypothetical protein